MRRSPTFLVAIATALLAGASVAMMFARSPVEPQVTIWKVTQLRDGQPVQTIHVHEPPLGNPAEAFGAPRFAAGESFLIEATEPPQVATGSSFFAPNRLPPSDRRMVEFLLLLPVAALFVCVCRNVVGLTPFGTFAPALLGLALHQGGAVLGVAIVLAVLGVGGFARCGFEHLHLLQVPRTALMLSIVVLILLVFIFAGCGGAGPSSIVLLPLVILTGMIERYWSMEQEEGSASSLRRLLTTLGIAGGVWALAAIPALSRWLMRYPETLGLVMAAQLLLGRYTGLRLLEAYRFRALVLPTLPDTTTARRVN
jgi:hypothetical protein